MKLNKTNDQMFSFINVDFNVNLLFSYFNEFLLIDFEHIRLKANHF